MPTIKRTPDPYAPCYCGNGRKYKFCHRPIDIAPAIDKREMSQKMYVQRWNVNASHFREQGCYSWMASILAAYSPKLILDIGCGNGDALLALKQVCHQDSRIISCDDNPLCLQTAYEKFQSAGIDAKLIRRMVQSAAGEQFHEMKICPGRLKNLSDYAQITLVEADIIWDEEFHNFLKSQPKFDAITVWLIGTFDLKPECKNIGERMEGSTYRLTVQNKVYKLADEILRAGGVLQIVDRGESPKEQFLIQDKMQAHAEQATGTSLKITECKFKDYEEPIRGNGVSMIETPGTSGRIENLKQLAMTSIISVKR